MQQPMTAQLKPELKVIISGKVPKGERVTPAALMPKILCCIEGEHGQVFRGREVVKRFRHFENALKKTDKIRKRECGKATKALNAIANGSAVFMRER